MIKLPVGRYNGRYIVGFRIQIIIRFDSWYWLPKFDHNFGEPYVIWLFWAIRFNQEFGNVKSETTN